MLFLIFAASLYLLSTLSASAATGMNLMCHIRGAVRISFFDYGLTTMKWKDRFQVGAGGVRKKRIGDHAFRLVTFQNGDDFVYDRQHNIYLIFIQGTTLYDKCRLEGTFDYPVTHIPSYQRPKITHTPD
ncbi:MULTISPECIES: hypothetical protein [Citrobacter]|uniref:hypothetical protein n=1 Tax=Citrobacter TaxID=544 RepID=UPI001020D792|nr:MULTISPECIES: hypothetical protein [Citrobacter]ELO4690293.1 hypothetical protein [Citrobacter koseri]EMD6813745.1 hypothetical protein [Citrobacter koseri]MBJ8804155.1 hypothetical protein [Citrobacter koseri]MBJ8865622.1 hypothetical protein [Citrobacter koseri]MBJ9119255.1 hypothetical protein [Citrobacter koseri]